MKRLLFIVALIAFLTTAAFCQVPKAMWNVKWGQSKKTVIGIITSKTDVTEDWKMESYVDSTGNTLLFRDGTMEPNLSINYSEFKFDKNGLFNEKIHYATNAFYPTLNKIYDFLISSLSVWYGWPNSKFKNSAYWSKTPFKGGIHVYVKDSMVVMDLTSFHNKNVANKKAPQVERQTRTKRQVAQKEHNADFDKWIDAYEKYMMKYIQLIKRAKAGDASVMSEYMDVAQKLQTAGLKLDNSQEEMTPEQVQRFLKIQEKVLKAAKEMRQK